MTGKPEIGVSCALSDSVTSVTEYPLPVTIGAIERFWGAISASGDVRTRCRAPGIGGTF